jgi:hypothetical protein
MDLDDSNFKKRCEGQYDQVCLKIVDTTDIRLKDINFTMGGHHYVYPNLIHEDEIWLDNCMDKDNVVATSIHEFVERTFMKFYGLEYEDAHDLSNRIEIFIRRFISEDLPYLDRKYIKGR